MRCTRFGSLTNFTQSVIISISPNGCEGSYPNHDHAVTDTDFPDTNTITVLSDHEHVYFRSSGLTYLVVPPPFCECR